MKKHTAPFLVPRYVTRFSCIGGDCEDTCCAGWNISLNKESFLACQTTLDPVLRPLFSQYLVRDKDAARPAQYGHIRMRDTECQECPFLSEDRLCQVQARLGEGALSDACTTYPREVLELNGVNQMVLYLSCPEAARLALLAEDAFEFDEMEGGIRLDMVKRIEPLRGTTLDTMDSVRVFFIQVLQCSDIPLEERLALIGLVCERLTLLLQEGRDAAIPDLIRGAEQLVEQGIPMPSLASRKARTLRQAELTSLFFLGRRNLARSTVQNRVVERVMQGLGFHEASPADPQALATNFETGLARLQDSTPSLNQILERYLINSALADLLPWAESTPLRSFTSLLIQYSILRLMLVGRAAAQETPLGPAELVETVHVFSRMFGHIRGFPDQIHRLLKGLDSDRLDDLYLLL